jgi:hypothetical protein
MRGFLARFSGHGGVIYRRHTDRRRISEADASAARTYLETQAPIEAEWAKTLGLNVAVLQKETTLPAPPAAQEGTRCLSSITTTLSVFLSA